MIEPGTMVRYIGPNSATYETGKIYEVVGYDEELDAYGVMSELDIAYCVSEDYLEPIN